MTAVLPDRPITNPTEDFLGRDSFVENIAKLILHAPPQSSLRIGVYGGWGEGKPSVLKLVQYYLQQEGQVCVWLTPWILSSREEVVEQLIRAIATELEIELDALDIARGTVKLAAQLGKTASDLSGKFKIAETFLGPIVQQYLNKRAVAQWRLLQAEIEKKLAGKKLIVFVDDVDRVRPELVPNLLLTLREGLDHPDYSYVMALSPEVVERGLKMVHEGWGEPREFLEKIVELPKQLPHLSAREVSRFTDMVLQQFGPTVDGRAMADITPLLPSNPRKLKLFLRYVASLHGVLSRFSSDEVDWRAL